MLQNLTFSLIKEVTRAYNGGGLGTGESYIPISLATLEARRADACCKFIEGIQSGSPIARLLCFKQAPTNTRDGLRPRANNKRVSYNTDRFGNVVIVKFVYLSCLGLLVIFIFVFMYVVKCCLDNEYNL